MSTCVLFPLIPFPPISQRAKDGVRVFSIQGKTLWLEAAGDVAGRGADKEKTEWWS